MTAKTSSNFLSTSTGTVMSEVSYLDARFLAAQPEYEELLRWAGIQKSWKVLDAGAGSGAYLPLLCELVGEDGGLTELDLAPENIEACQARIRDLKPACQIETKVGSVLQLPFGDAVFDAVWCANTSQYLPDEAHEFACGEDQGALVWVSRRLGILGGIVLGVLGTVSSHSVGRFDEIVAQVAIAALTERGVLGLELAGLMSEPGQAGELSDGVVIGKALDIAKFGDQAGG